MTCSCAPACDSTPLGSFQATFLILHACCCSALHRPVSSRELLLRGSNHVRTTTWHSSVCRHAAVQMQARPARGHGSWYRRSSRSCTSAHVSMGRRTCKALQKIFSLGCSMEFQTHTRKLARRMPACQGQSPVPARAHPRSPICRVTSPLLAPPTSHALTLRVSRLCPLWRCRTAPPLPRTGDCVRGAPACSGGGGLR